MDREQLFQNLSELEKQLKGIKSATEQVNSVVAANRETIAAVSAYTAQAQQFLNSVKNVYDGEAAQIKKAAVEALNKSAKDFEGKINIIATDLVKNTEGLQKMVENTLKPLVQNDLVGLIDSNLKPFVNEQMPLAFNSLIDEYNSHFGSTLDRLKDATDNFSTEASKAISSIGNVKTIVEGSQKTILDSVSSMKKTVDAMKAQIDKDVEVSKKAGEDTVKAAEKIDKVSDSFSKATKEIKDHFDAGVQFLSTDIQNKADSLNSILIAISGDIDGLKKSVKSVKEVSRDINEVSQKVDKVDAEVAALKKDNSLLKTVVIIAVVLQLVTLVALFIK